MLLTPLGNGTSQDSPRHARHKWVSTKQSGKNSNGEHADPCGTFQSSPCFTCSSSILIFQSSGYGEQLLEFSAVCDTTGHSLDENFHRPYRHRNKKRRADSPLVLMLIASIVSADLKTKTQQDIGRSCRKLAQFCNSCCFFAKRTELLYFSFSLANAKKPLPARHFRAEREEET